MAAPTTRAAALDLIMEKVPAHRAFVDLSDYARPAARWLVRRLLPTPVSPLHITLAYTAVGLAAASLFALDRWLLLAAALLLKSMLDAADGALARARQRPSRVGRFLDSVCDFVVTAAVFAGITLGESRRTGSGANWLLAIAAVLFATLQGSVFSYYSVRYRTDVGGDRTSAVREESARGYPWDNPPLLRLLHALYRIIYGWQDRLMDWIDRRVLRLPADSALPPSFLTATTVLGLGMQLLVVAACAALGQPAWALWAFVTVFNGYWIILLVYRRISYASHYSQTI